MNQKVDISEWDDESLNVNTVVLARNLPDELLARLFACLDYVRDYGHEISDDYWSYIELDITTRGNSEGA
jgi:hypothetical protein